MSPCLSFAPVETEQMPTGALAVAIPEHLSEKCELAMWVRRPAHRQAERPDRRLQPARAQAGVGTSPKTDGWQTLRMGLALYSVSVGPRLGRSYHLPYSAAAGLDRSNERA